MKWRVVKSFPTNGPMNMAIDEAILKAHAEKKVPPTIRFYGWSPPTLSLGYFQHIEREVNVKECQRRGIDIVRRLTGGRAVFHDKELTYSIIVSEDYPLLPKTITASYRFLSEGILAGLCYMGINAQMNIPRAAYSQMPKVTLSAACFDAPSHYEITVDGHKLVGSAQVRKEGILLQHGSILLDFSAEVLAAILRVPADKALKSLEMVLKKKATSLAQITGRIVEWEEVYKVLVKAFAPALGVTIELGELTDKEKRMSDQLAVTKYNCREWTFRR